MLCRVRVGESVLSRLHAFANSLRSQTHHLLHFTELRRARRLVEAKLQRLWAQIRLVVKPPHYYVDVIASPSNDTPALILDMKPFRVRRVGCVVCCVRVCVCAVYVVC